LARQQAIIVVMEALPAGRKQGVQQERLPWKTSQSLCYGVGFSP